MGSKYRIQAIFFALTFILAQSVIIFAEFDHPLHEPDSSCNVCLAAGHLSHGITSADLSIPQNIAAAPEYSLPVNSFIPALLTLYSVRAPPLL